MNLTAQRLAQTMEERGLDQSQLARELGVTQGAISKILLGKTSNSRLIPKIAAHLGVSLPWLLGQPIDDSTDRGGILSTDERELIEHVRLLAPDDRRAFFRIARLAALPSGETLHDRQQTFRAEG